jgi:hypothetical protein
VSLSNTARCNQTIHRRFSRRSLTFIWIKIRRRRCHENASDCLRLDRCGGDAGDTSTCLLFTRLPSRRTMSRVQRSVPATLRSGALLWSTATLRSGAVLRFAATIWSALLRLRLGQPIWRSSTAGNSSWARDDVGRAAAGRLARSDALAPLDRLELARCAHHNACAAATLRSPEPAERALDPEIHRRCFSAVLFDLMLDLLPFIERSARRAVLSRGRAPKREAGWAYRDQSQKPFGPYERSRA